jgi:hypothetical protein
MPSNTEMRHLHRCVELAALARWSAANLAPDVHPAR